MTWECERADSYVDRGEKRIWPRRLLVVDVLDPLFRDVRLRDIVEIVEPKLVGGVVDLSGAVLPSPTLVLMNLLGPLRGGGA